MVDYWVMESHLKYFRSVALGGIFLMPFLVLVVLSSLFFPFITGKNFLFRIIVEIIFGCWVVLAIYDKKYRPKKSFILYFLLAFVAGMVLSTIFGANPYKSFWSNYERMEGLVTFLHLLGYFLVASSMLNTEKLWRLFLNTTIVSSVIVSFYGLLQLAGAADIHQGGVRLDASLGNAAYLAIYAVFHIFLAMVLFVRELSGLRWLYAALAVLETFILYYTATRGAILGFIGGILLAGAVLVLLSDQKKIKVVGSGVLAAILVVVGIFWLARNSSFVTSSPVLSRFSTISTSEITTQSRLVIWRMAYEGFKEKPALGWGPENFNLVFNKYFQPILYRQEPWFDRAHNVFFDRLTSGGVAGLVTYLGLFASTAFYLLFRRKELGFSAQESALFTAMLAAYFAHNIFVFDNLISLIMFFSVLAYLQSRLDINTAPVVVAQPNQKREKGATATAPASDYQKSVFAVAVIVASLYSLYFINYRPYATNKSLIGALREDAAWGSAAGTEENFKKAFSGFQKAIGYNSFGSAEAREHLTNFAMKVVSSATLTDEQKQQVYGYAVNQIEEQMSKYPGDIRYMLFAGNLYSSGGQLDRAIAVMENAIELSPNKQQLYFELASAYFGKADFANGLATMKKALELDTTYEEARKTYATGLILAGQDSEAEKLIKEGFGTEFIPDARMANAYASKKEFAKVATIFEKIVAANPSDFNSHLKLAAAYAELKQNAKAIAEIQKVIELNPAFKEQGEAYINQLK